MIIKILIIFLILNIINLFRTQDKFTNLNNIDKIFVINLNESKERMDKIRKQCKQANLQIQRFSAINGKNINRNDVKDLIDNKFLVKIPNGVLGCSLSHIKIWQKVAKSNYNNVLILEDDIIIPKNFWYLFNEYYKKLPPNWDIVYLGGSNIYGKLINDKILLPINNIKNRGNTVNLGTYAYLIKKKTAIRLLKEVLPINKDFDFCIKQKFHKNNIYYFYKPLILHDNDQDSIRRIIDGRKSKASLRWRFIKQSNITLID